LIFVLNREDRIEYCNSSALKLIGCEKREAVGRAFTDFVFEDRDEVMGKNLKSVFDSGKPVTFENCGVTLSGKDICLEVRLSPIANGDKTTGAVLGIARDITEQKRRELLIAHSRREWLQAVDGMPYPLALVRSNHRIERLNLAMANRLGSTVRDAIGLTCFEALHGTPEPPSFCPLLNGKDANAHSSKIIEHHNDDDLLCTISAIRDSDGMTTGCLYVARRISESDRATEVKRSGEEYMRMLLKGSDHMVYIQNADGRYAYFSAMPGNRIPWGVIGGFPFDFFEPGVAFEIVGRVKEAVKRGTELTHQLDFTWGEEVLRFFDRIVPVRDAMGRIQAVTTVSMKVAEFRHSKGKALSGKHGSKDLSGREREVLRLIALGLTSSQIATGLSISRKTVETHRARIMRKLDVHKTSALVSYAAKAGLLD
ncbi:MAG TPA: PAS domain-containing protein, partial [Syntrophobacteraceae bacterium]|nr:PAS domain-containing protein [Syntrophobacteraceae bacterium]